MNLKSSFFHLLALTSVGVMTVFTSILAQAADDRSCWSDKIHNVNLSTTVQIGSGSKEVVEYNTGSSQYTGQCYCSPESAKAGTGPYYFAATTPLPVEGEYLIFSPEVKAAVRIKVYGRGDAPVPFTPLSNIGSYSCMEGINDVPFSTGGSGVVGLVTTKGVLGNVRFSGLVATLYGAWNSHPKLSGDPLSVVYMDLDVQAAANCTFNAGSQLSLGLDSVTSGSLREGAPPVGFTPKSLDLSVTCTGIPEGFTSVLSYYFDGIRATPRFVQTTLPSIGIGIQDENGAPILLGGENTINVPYINNGTSFRAKFFPALLPGKPIQAGDYSASVVVTVSTP